MGGDGERAAREILILGVLGEYVGRAFLSANGKPQGVVRDIVRAEGMGAGPQPAPTRAASPWRVMPSTSWGTASTPAPATPAKAQKGKGKLQAGLAKYRDPVTGQTWTGRGRAPKWLEGRKKEDFLIKQ